MSNTYIRWPGSTGGSSGTVTSVGLSAPAFLTVSGSPVTTSGTLALTLATQSANRIFAGPTTGGAAAPTFRALVTADLPALGAGNLTTTTTGVTITTGTGALVANAAVDIAAANGSTQGLLTAGTQTIGGDKTFTGNITAANLSGTNTGDVTLAAVGSSPNANGASLSGQILTLQPADGTNPGVLTAIAQTIAGVKTYTSPAIWVMAPTTYANNIQMHTTGTAYGSAESTLDIVPSDNNHNTSIHSYNDGQFVMQFHNHNDSYVRGSVSNSLNFAWQVKGQVQNAGAIPQLMVYTPFDGTAHGNTIQVTDRSEVTQSGVDYLGRFFDNNFTASTALVADSSKKIQSSSVTSTELGYVSGVTSAIQTQINAKLTSPLTTKGDVLTFSTVPARLAVGADGTVLTADSVQATGLSWTSVLTNPMTTLGDIIYENATPAAARLAGNTTTTKKYLSQTGNGTISAAPAWAQVAFADISGTASSTQVNTSTFVAPTVQRFTSASSGTYTTPTSPRVPVYIRVRMVGGGGGGGGSGSTGGSSGSNGGNTTFGSSLLTANGGVGGGNNGGSGGAGGTAANTAAGMFAITGGGGVAGGNQVTSNGAFGGGAGGNSMFGGGAQGKAYNTAGADGDVGGGGSGGGSNNTIGVSNGGGGGAGGGVDAIITAPSATYSYACGAAGAGGSAGTNGFAGGNGGVGFIVVEEFYQ